MPPRREVVNFPVDDSVPPSSPLYLHPSDNPGTILVPDLFNGTNFVDWSKSMKMALLAKNKLGFIDGSINKPTDSGDPTFAFWERCNGMVVSWLLNSIASKIKSSLMYLESARQIWLDIKERFSQGNIARIYELKQKLNNLRQGSNSINMYYTDLRVIWDEFLDFQPKCWCECGNCKCKSSQKWREHLDQDFAVQFLMGLNDSYSTLRSHFLSLDPFPNVSKIFSLVLQEERQKGFGTGHALMPAPVSESPSSVNVAKNFAGRGRDKMFCTHCQKPNHTVDRCFRLHGYPPSMGRGRGRGTFSDSRSHVQRSVNSVETGNKSDGHENNAPPSTSPVFPNANPLTADQCHKLISFLQAQMGGHTLSADSAPANSSSGSCDYNPNFSGMFSLTPFIASFTHSKTQWLIDTGATHHVCCSLSLFSSHTKLSDAFITLPNSQQVPIDSIGTVTLSADLTLHSVFYVPNFSHNLISISSLTSGNTYSVTFTHDNCILQDLSKGMKIGMGRRIGKLYVLDLTHSSATPDPVVQDSSISSALVDFDTWHCRLGHLGPDKLHLLSSVINIKSVPKHICEICPLSKQRRLSFPVSSSIASNVFDLIHCDVWGPFTPITVLGHIYFLTIVDDHSRFVWTYLMEQKSEVKTILTQFFKQVSTQFGKSIKTIRCDNGSEFFLSDLYSSFGTVVQHSCVERPQQNGRVERKHQHLLTVARSLFFQSNIPLAYWGDCVLTASYLINRIPSSIPQLSNLTPFQILHKKPPSYSHLRSFGCLCYVSTLLRHRHKFSPRATKCVFLGYPTGYKGYKVLDLETNKVIISRDIIFHESVYPFKTDPSSPSESSFPLFMPSQLSVPFPSLDDTHVPSVPTTPSPSFPTTSSGRTIKPPSHLNDYICGSVKSPSLYPLSSFVGSTHLTPQYSSFISSITIVPEPTHYKQAVLHAEWREAMKLELDALQQAHTWSLVPLPAGKTAIGCKWVYRVKFQSDGSVERYKARLVAQGFTQQAGVDYLDTFSPVARLVSVKLLLAVSAAKRFHLCHLDINNAFLYGDLKEEIYMTPPKGLCTEGEHAGLVCRLHKSLYGLKQASRQWYFKFTEVLQDFGLHMSSADHSYYHMTVGELYFGVIIYVDDILISSSSLSYIEKFKHHLSHYFKFKDLGVPKYFLGLEIARNADGISVCQRKYVLDLLKDTGLLGCKPFSTPMDSKCSLAEDGSPPLKDAKSYRRLIGRLLYLCITRPDVTFAVHKLSQFVSSPCEHHLLAAHRVLKYLKSSIGLGLFYSSSNTLEPSIFADADWGTCTDTRRSVSGFCLFLGSALISWRSKKQQVVSRSSAESEYRALAEAACEVSWIDVLLKDFGIIRSKAVPLFCDNKAAVYLTSNAAFHERTKHIEIDCHTVRDRFRQGLIKPMHIRSALQLADVFTKAVTPSLFARLLDKMSLCNIHAHLEGEYEDMDTNG